MTRQNAANLELKDSNLMLTDCHCFHLKSHWHWKTAVQNLTCHTPICQHSSFMSFAGIKKTLPDSETLILFVQSSTTRLRIIIHPKDKQVPKWGGCLQTSSHERPTSNNASRNRHLARRGASSRLSVVSVIPVSVFGRLSQCQELLLTNVEHKKG